MRTLLFDEPNPCRAGRVVEEQVIRMIVAIKIRNARHTPASGQSWTVGVTDPNIVAHIPDCRLTRGCVKKKEI